MVFTGSGNVNVPPPCLTQLVKVRVKDCAERVVALTMLAATGIVAKLAFVPHFKVTTQLLLAAGVPRLVAAVELIVRSTVPGTVALAEPLETASNQGGQLALVVE